MANNKFDIRVIMTHGENDINPIYGDILEGFTVNQLPLINEKIGLNQNLRLYILGDIDVKNLINKGSKFDDSYFPWLVITGNFYCSKYSKNFPRIVCGTFDCSGLGKDYITSDMFLPLTREINCAYSITDFDVLMDILPYSLETLVVEPKLIKKSVLLKDNEHLKKTLLFIEKYQDVTVLDTNGNNLLNILYEIDRDFEEKKSQAVAEKLKSETQKIESMTQKIQETFEIKVNGKHLDIKEIFAYCRTKKEYDIFTDNVLERLIRIVLSDQRKNGIQKKTMRRADGVNVVCVDASQKEIVCQDILELAKEKEKSEEKIIVKKTEETVVKPVAEKIKPINIKKYIKPGQLKDIKKSSGEQNAISALRAIQEINMDPLNMQFQGSVHIIKDGKETVSATVKKESGCCLVQSIDSSNHDDTKRIVWNVADGPDGLIIMCVGFREHHNTKKASNLYADLRNKALKKQSYTQDELVGYLNVDDILNSSGNCDDYNDGELGDNMNISGLNNTILSSKFSELLQHKR